MVHNGGDGGGWTAEVEHLATDGEWMKKNRLNDPNYSPCIMHDDDDDNNITGSFYFSSCCWLAEWLAAGNGGNDVDDDGNLVHASSIDVRSPLFLVPWMPAIYIACWAPQLILCSSTK